MSAKDFFFLDNQEDITIRCPLVGGEKIIANCCVSYNSPWFGPCLGSLVVTNYRFWFRSGNGLFIHDMPLGAIQEIKRVNDLEVNLSCKAGYSLVITRMRFQLAADSSLDLYAELTSGAFPLLGRRKLFAFSYTQTFPENGWAVYDPVEEFRRQGVPNQQWRISTINAEYKICETYPSVIAVPAQATDELVEHVAQFRRKGRVPVLSWVHPQTRASITRCSQPGLRLGFTSTKHDEAYLACIAKAGPETENTPTLHVADARLYYSALGNQAVGGGYENYSNTEIFFLGIDNIHAVRSSIKNPTKWLYHIKTVLDGAYKIAHKVLDENKNVLVHCSDGWDRTAQLTSLSMLLADPYYATLKGFQVLIEKEWCSIGHKFEDRYGHGKSLKAGKASEDDQRSPIFDQFIECVWQIMIVSPFVFEFNENFLITVLDHLHSNLFGTFLYNSEKIRRENGVPETTQSLWSMINSNAELYINPFYAHRDRDIDLNDQPKNLRVWRAYHERWNPNYAKADDVTGLQPFSGAELLGMNCTQLNAYLNKRWLGKFHRRVISSIPSMVTIGVSTVTHLFFGTPQ